MRFVNELAPTQPEQLAAFADDGPPGPVVMINLLKFRAQAQYEDGRATTLSGREAYALYGAEVLKLVRARGGRLLYAGEITFCAVGQVDPLWDQVAIMEFPSRRALFEMAQSPEWQAISEHRTAGLEGQLDIESTWHPRLREMLPLLFPAAAG